jgi:hypothetical protein
VFDTATQSLALEPLSGRQAATIPNKIKKRPETHLTPSEYLATFL